MFDQHMTRIAFIGMLACIPSIFAQDIGHKKWQHKVSMLTNGMQRAQVEQLFPHSGGLERIQAEGGGYTITYNIDEYTAIRLAYDYDGSSNGADVSTAVPCSPSNRLQALRGLIQQKRRPPLILVTTNRMIEPSSRGYK